MPSKPNQSIANQLNSARVAINNALDDAAILPLLGQFGYTPEKLNAGKALYEAAATAVNAQQAAAGTQREATAALKAADKLAHTAYQNLAKVIRAVYVGQPEMLASLGLDKPMPKDIAGFLTAGYTLFDNALTGKNVALADVGYTPEKLQSERQKIASLDTANRDQEAAKGGAQQSTQDQDAALASLKAWMAKFTKIARVALQSKPQLLEKLGIVAKRK